MFLLLYDELFQSSYLNVSAAFKNSDASPKWSPLIVRTETSLESTPPYPCNPNLLSLKPIRETEMK